MNKANIEKELKHIEAKYRTVAAKYKNRLFIRVVLRKLRKQGLTKEPWRMGASVG